MNPLWSNIFGNNHPVEVEIGPGTGTFLLSVAAQHPERNFFAIEHSRSRAEHLKAAVAAHRLSNVRTLDADAGCVVCSLVPSASVAAYHIYFPDPWWKRRHQRRRLFTPAFGRALARTLVGAGRVNIATDVDQVFTLIRATLEAAHVFRELVDAPSPRCTVTSFERKGLARGAVIHRGTFARDPLTAGRAASQANSAAPITPAESPS